MRLRFRLKLGLRLRSSYKSSLTSLEMAQNLVDKILQQRAEFISHLKKDIAKNNEVIKFTEDRINDLKITEANVRELGKKVEHTSLIPLGKNIYVNGKIIHTGEYFLDKLAFPESYSIVETLDGTIEQLEYKIKKQSEILQKSENAKEQLEERIKLLEGDESSGESDETPKEIVSDKGVAIKFGDYYEIVEFEN